MKIPFPASDEILVCHKCTTAVHQSFDYSEDGDEDFPWCPGCEDYVSGIIKKR